MKIFMRTINDNVQEQSHRLQEILGEHQLWMLHHRFFCYQVHKDECKFMDWIEGLNTWCKRAFLVFFVGSDRVPL